MYRLLFSLIGSVALISSLSAEKINEKTTLSELKNIVVSGPYCGIYSLYACLDACNKKPPIEELLVPEYVGSFRGSTAEELIKAAEKYGLQGKCYANMTWRQLQNAKGPMILHFRGSGDSDFNHWIAFLGIEGKLARIIDVPHELAHLSMAELLAQWDGVAIVLSEKPIHDEPIWESRFDYFSVVLFLLGGVFVFKTFFWSEKKEPSASENRLDFTRRYATQTIALLGTIGFPINSDLAERKKILQGIDKSQKIIVYCQSAGCGYADDIVAFLKFNGYRNISIYRGGYREWKAGSQQNQITKS